MDKRKVLLPSVVAVVFALSFGAVAGLLRTQHVGADVVSAGISNPNADFISAQSASPYRIRQPSSLPAGTTLTHVSWIDPEQVKDRTVFSVDLWYVTKEGTSIHLWETNNPFLANTFKDPSVNGTPDQLAGGEWQLSSVAGEPGQVVLSRQLPDGITLSLNAVIDRHTLETIANSIT